MTSSPTQVTHAVSSKCENIEFKEGKLTAFFPPEFYGYIDGKIFFHLEQVKDDKLRVALGKFGLWKEDIKVKYFLDEGNPDDEGNPEKPAADCIVLLDDEPSPPEIVEIYNGNLITYGNDWGMVIEDISKNWYELKINAVIDNVLESYLQDTFPIEKKSVQFILHWQKNKNGDINQVIHSLILAKEERIILNEKYGQTEIQPKLMSPESLPDYKPLSPMTIRTDIRTDNIFKVGGVVEGKSLIGYEEKYEILLQKILNEQKSLSFIGLPKTGKTSLIKKIHQEAKSNKKIIDIFISNLQDFASKENPFATFLFDIAEKVKNELSKRIDCDTKNASNFYAGFDELQKYHISNNHGEIFQDTFKKLFQKIKKLDMHVLLSVDEFDSAEKIFKDTADYNTIFDDLANSKYAINIVLISNRQEKESEENFSIQSGLSVPYKFLKLIREKYDVRMRPETISLEGFDIKLISSILRKDYSIHLSDVQIKQIKYYAGRSPYIYSAFCYHIVEEKLKSGKNSFDIEKIYKDNVEPIIAEYTEVLYKLLENGGHLDKINNILFDSENCDEESENISRFISIGYLKECNLKGDCYQVFSSYFTDYLRKQYFSQYYSKSIAKNILNLHKLIKTMILKSFKNLTEDEWEKVMKTVHKESNSNAFNRDIIKKNKQFFKKCNEKSALFNALPLKRVFYILKTYWEPVFKKYFNNQEFSSFEKKFELCGKIRDVVCHANESFINEEKTKDLIKVNSFCIEIINLIGKNWQMVLIEFDPLIN